MFESDEPIQDESVANDEKKKYQKVCLKKQYNYTHRGLPKQSKVFAIQVKKKDVSLSDGFKFLASRITAKMGEGKSMYAL